MGTGTTGVTDGKAPTAGQLRVFVALAEELHFGRASDRLAIAGSSLSERLRRLESTLAVTLFERSSRRVALTDSGAALLPRARDILRRLESLQHLGGEPAQADGGALRVGIYGAGFGEFTQPAVEAFRARHPHARLVLRELSDGGPQRFVDGPFDVAMTHLPWEHERLVVHPIATEPRVMLMPARHERAAMREASIDSAGRFPRRERRWRTSWTSTAARWSWRSGSATNARWSRTSWRRAGRSWPGSWISCPGWRSPSAEGLSRAGCAP